MYAFLMYMPSAGHWLRKPPTLEKPCGNYVEARRPN